MLSHQAYFQRPGVSSHALVEFQRTPLHCWAKYVDPNRQDEEPTPALRFGTLVHTLVLAPETFAEDFVQADSIHRRTQEGKAEHAALLESGQADRHRQGISSGDGRSLRRSSSIPWPARCSKSASRKKSSPWRANLTCCRSRGGWIG